jgi:hypothetical protein
MMQRCELRESRKVGLAAAVSDRALKVGYFRVSSFDQEGTRDHLAGASIRSPDAVVTRRGIVLVGAIFQLGTHSGKRFVVARNQATTASVEWSKAKRPHTFQVWP